MSTFYELFFAKSKEERKRIADGAGISLGYILKQVYVKARNPCFRFANAVRLDKASNGKLPFYRFAESAEEIDWEYVLKRLRQGKRRNEFPQKEA